MLGNRVEEGQYTVGLQPLMDIHMNPDFPAGYSTVVNPVYVRVLIGLALLILTIACINFVTLSVSRSLGRSKEVGVRKVMGAGRNQLMGQYWGEALLLTGVSVAIGLSLASVALPAFNNIAQRSLTLSWDWPTGLTSLHSSCSSGSWPDSIPPWCCHGLAPLQPSAGVLRVDLTRA